MSARPRAFCFQALTPASLPPPPVTSSSSSLQSQPQRLTASERGGLRWKSKPREGQGRARGNTVQCGQTEGVGPPAFPMMPGRNPFPASPRLLPSPSEHSLNVLLPPPPVLSFSLPHFSCPTHFLRTQPSIAYSRKPSWIASPSPRFPGLRGTFLSFP